MKIELGHYSVNGKIHASKMSAIFDAQRTLSPIIWHYYEDILEKAKWETEPDISLDTLYQLRARQIREEYDYIIVFISGGADSTNIIRTFLKNNIFVDEVIAIAPLSGLKNWKWDRNDLSNYNFISEIMFAQFPMLEEISKKDSRIKITLLDTFEEAIHLKTDEWIYNPEINYINPVPTSAARLDNLPHLSSLADSGKRIACIYGIDKPTIGFRPTGEVVSIISDLATTSRVVFPFKNQYQNVDRIPFYMTHKLPEIMIKQAHIIAREILKKENKDLYNVAMRINSSWKPVPQSTASDDEVLAKVLPYYNGKYDPPKVVRNDARSIFQRLIVPYLYPSTHDSNLFQVEKPDPKQTFFWTGNSWLWDKHAGVINKELIISDFKLFFKSISPHYLNNERTGILANSRSFKIGMVQDFASK
jgi:hypothetical protein